MKKQSTVKKLKDALTQFNKNPNIETGRLAFILCHETESPYPKLLLDIIAKHFGEIQKKAINDHIKVITKKAQTELHTKGMLLQCALECNTLEEAYSKYKSLYPKEIISSNSLRKRLERYLDKQIPIILQSNYNIDINKDLLEDPPKKLTTKMKLAEKVLFFKWLNTD